MLTMLCWKKRYTGLNQRFRCPILLKRNSSISLEKTTLGSGGAHFDGMEEQIDKLILTCFLEMCIKISGMSRSSFTHMKY